MNNFETYEDERLTKELSKNDSREAFEELYNRYWKKLLLHAVCHIGSEQEAEEIVQNVFMNIWRSRKKLQIKHTFYTYIFACTKYEIIAMLAKRKKQINSQQFSFSALGREADNHTTEWMDYESTRKQLEDTILGLPEKCQLVFRLSRNEGLSEKQISLKLDISSKTVQAHMTKALKILRARLQH